MANTNNKQFISIDNIDFIQDLTPETATNYVGGACTFADTASTSEAGNQKPNFYSYRGMEYLHNPVNTNTSGFTAYEDNSTWWR